MKKTLAILMTLVLSIGVLIPVTATQAANGEKTEYLVQFAGPSEVGLMNAFGVKSESVLHEYQLLPVKLLELTEAQAKGLQNHPHILHVEPNAEAHTLSQTVPWGISHVQAITAHNSGYTGENVKVAILDTGIDNKHEDLFSNVKGGYSVFTDSANSDPFYDGNGHGTHVAGTVAALDNNLGVIGVAYNADLYAVKVLNNSGSGSYDGIAQGIEWAVNNGMDIINMSLGGSASSAILENMVNAANNAGVLLIAAAGNSGNIFGWGDTVGYPAKYGSVMAVAAIDSNNRRANFSSHGPAVEISAPGVSVLSTTPGNNYASFNGTSMASPHVAGVAALIKGANPTLSNSQIRQIMNDTALNLGTWNYFGNGLVRAMNGINLALSY